MKKVLITASTKSHLETFHIPYIRLLKNKNCEVHVAFNGEGSIELADKSFNVGFGRSPFDSENIAAYRYLRNLISRENYVLIHCHTPMVSVITRLASRKIRKENGAKVLYTSHGFHFFEGAPVKNWIVYYSIEKLLSNYCDVIITINKEDFRVLHKRRFKCKGKYRINGIGLDEQRLRIESYDRDEVRHELGLKKNDLVLLYIAEFIDRKNHRFIIENLPSLVERFPQIKVLFAGRGELFNSMQILCDKQGLCEYVTFLGYTKEIGKYIVACDIGLSASRQEGLGLGVAELMMNGIPVVVSEDRGHREMVKDGVNGLMFPQEDGFTFCKKLESLLGDSMIRERLGKEAKKSMSKFYLENPLSKMSKIYDCNL